MRVRAVYPPWYCGKVKLKLRASDWTEDSDAKHGNIHKGIETFI